MKYVLISMDCEKQGLQVGVPIEKNTSVEYSDIIRLFVSRFHDAGTKVMKTRIITSWSNSPPSTVMEITVGVWNNGCWHDGETFEICKDESLSG